MGREKGDGGGGSVSEEELKVFLGREDRSDSVLPGHRRVEQETQIQ